MKSRDSLQMVYTMVMQNTVSNKKTESITNIIIQKITERIESYKILEVNDDEGAIQLLINIKYTVIVADTGFPIRNTPHSTSLVFYETNVRDP